MENIEEKKYQITTDKNNKFDLLLRNYNNEKLSITLNTINEYQSKKYELKCNLEEFQKNRFFKIFINIEEIMKELENKIEKSIFIEDTNCIIIEIKIGLTIINEILLVIEEQEKNKDEIIEELKKKIELLHNKLNDSENKIKLNEAKEKEIKEELCKKIKILENKLKDAENKIKLNEKENDNQTNKIKELTTFLNNKKFEYFKIENMKNIKTLNNNEECIVCLKTLDDGRLAAADTKSNLIIYNNETFKPDIIIKNNLKQLWNFTQLKNKNIACSFKGDFTLKIIKIKNNNEYEDIQTINNAHNNHITKIIELKNENLITFLLIVVLKYGN